MENLRIFRITILYACCLFLLPVSCSLIDFSEDCTWYGDIEIKPDWSALAKDETKPPLTDIYLLSPQHNYTYIITADTLVKDIQAVSYNVLACNAYGLENIRFYGMDCPDTAKAELTTYQKDGKLYTLPAPAFYAANTNLTVIPFETAVCAPVLQSAVRQIHIDFVVTGNADMAIGSISGELSGIAYKYGFKGLDALESSARLAFVSERDSGTGNENLFSSSLKVFGVNPGKQGIDRIDNLLEVVLQTTDGNTYRDTIDLTNILSGFTGSVIHITIEIRLGVMGIEVTVTGWNISEGGSIEI